MAKKKEEVDAAEAAEETATAPQAEPEETTGPATEALVYTASGALARVYTKERHGAAFRKFGEEYAAKIGGKVKFK